ncbi:MAG: DUF3160 domain-containing protein [Oscillospiraceae bacterium]|nr:DUF3160 domain-containing protein [Oscillospiraceae bacterium]
MPFRRVISFFLCLGIFLTLPACGGQGTKPANSVQSEVDSKKSEESTRYQLAALSNSISKEVSVPYHSTQITPKIEPYKVNSELSNVENLQQFGSFSQEQKQHLAKNAFVVSPSAQEQLFYIYEKNAYLKIPSLITTDSVLQVYHVFYDYSLRSLESDSLIGAVDALTDSMLKKSIQIYKGVKNSAVKSAALKNIAYFGTAALALQKQMPWNMPEPAVQLAEKEYNLIQEQSGFMQSEIFPFKLDYSQFTPRGHYTRSDDFKRYFVAMTWYGQAPFPFYIYKDKEQKTRDVEQTLQALLITYALFMNENGSQDLTNWETVYEPTSFYVGQSDDLTIYQYKDLLKTVYGEDPNLEQLNDSGLMNKLYQEAEKLPEPRIQAEYTEQDTPVGRQFRFMGQRYIPDSEILQELVEPIKRPIPSGLDVMGVLGSDRAYQIQLGKKENEWEGYPVQFAKTQEQFSALSGDTWRSNLYYGWLWTLQGLLKPYETGYPSFMTNQAWTDKSLSTALGSWSELRHDTILYGKQSGAEKGGAEEPKVLGYVEPAVEVYDKLLWLTEYSEQNLSARGLLKDGEVEWEQNLKHSIQDFKDLLTFLRDCSVKELNGETLSDEEYSRIYEYGATMEHLTASLSSDGLRWFEIESETDKNMAIIADFHTVAPNSYDNGGYLEAGVGPAHEIYAVVPIGGKLYLTRGAVFSYYEFESGSRLTDEAWQKQLKEDKAPAQPSWVSSFVSGGKGEIPEPQEPYNS